MAGITAEQKQNASLMGHVSERLNSELNQLNEILANIPVDYAPVQRRKIAMVWDLDDPFWYPATKQAYRTAKILNFDITVFAPKGRGEAGTLEMVHFLKRCWRSVMMESVSHPLRISEWKIAAEDGREGCGGDFHPVCI